jgi:transposase
MTNQLSHASLISDLSNVTLRRVFNTDQGWIMEAHGQNSAVCPGCQSISRSRHSRYWRSLKDLPVQGTQVMLRLHLGRWRCRNAGCQRRIFTERLSKVCAPYAQQTKRTSEIIAAMGHALGGRPGERLMRRLGMPVSGDTLIRQVKRAAHLSALSQVRVLGVDDWAWCKGQTFGTILVDLERSQVVDLLPTRSADSLGEWLAQHPEITTISRDRQGVYAEGARRVAPEAVQVADRFHLVLNLTQAVERELAVNRRQLRIASPSAPVLPPSPTTEEVKSRSEPIRVRSGVMMHQMEVARQRQQQKLELFRTIKKMRAAGMKVSQIAKQLGLVADASINGSCWTNCRKEAGCSRARECPNRSETIYVSVGRRAAGTGARYWRRFGSSATSVATPDWQNSFRRGASQKQRPEGRIPRSPRIAT